MKLEKLKNLLRGEGPLLPEDFLGLGLSEEELRQIMDVVSAAITQLKKENKK